MEVSHSACPQTLSVSQKHSHKHMLTCRRSPTVTVPVWLSVCLSQIRIQQQRFTSLVHCGWRSLFHRQLQTGLTCILWKLLGKSESKVGNSWQFHASGRSFVTAQHYGDERFTIMMNTSLGAVPCPAGCRMRTLHTYSHKSFTLCLHNVPTWTQSSTQKQPHSISSLYILKYRMKTEIKLNKTLGAEAGLV